MAKQEKATRKQGKRKAAETTSKRKNKGKEQEEPEVLDLHNLGRYSLDELKNYCAEHKLETEGPASRKRTFIKAITNHAQHKHSHRKEDHSTWDEWKEIYLAGTEWHAYDEVFKFDWDFSHLEAALDEGFLFEAGQKRPVFLFGATEPQLLSTDPDNPEKQTMVYLPVIVAVATQLPRPTEVAIASIQGAEEKMVKMAHMKMAWVPHIPPAAWTVDPASFAPLAYFLKTVQRRAGLKQLKDERLRTYEYAIPYIDLPLKQGFVAVKVTTVTMKVSDKEEKERDIQVPFDWSSDTLTDFVEDLMENYNLGKDKEQEVTQHVRNQVNAHKASYREQKAAWDAKIEKLPESVRTAMEETKCYKFYPKNTFPDFSAFKVSFINRYYGHADEVL